MKKITGITIIFAAVLFLAQNYVYSQSYAQDTVWTKVTDQSQGFWKVKFSNNDSIIVGHGMEMDIFYNALNSEEFMRIPGNTEIFFINNDINFIRLKQGGLQYEIFDSKSYIKIDSIDNQGIVVKGYPSISNNERYITAQISHGFGIWDIQGKNLLKTKLLNPEPNLIYYEILGSQFNCTTDKIIGQQIKTYEDPQHPGDQKYYKTFASFVVYNFNTLDSIDNYTNARGYRLSNTCKYFVSLTGEPTYGVEIYDFNTKQLLHRLPINGPSLTGIEFSPDDKYIVTSGHGIIIWDVNTGQQTHFYPGDWQCIDISHDGKEIISNGSQDFWMWKSRFGGTPVPVMPQFNEILYPNPSTGVVNVDNIVTETIKIYNTNGVIQTTIKPINSENGIRFNVSNLPNGEYLISIEGMENKTYKLIIIK